MNFRIARALRGRMTDAEQSLWFRLRRKQIDGRHFRRQAPIGPFVADFICFQSKLIIEVDGGQHALRVDADAERTAWLAKEGFRVLRFWNNEIFENIEGVVESIHSAIAEYPPPQPSPTRGEGDQV